MVPVYDKITEKSKLAGSPALSNSLFVAADKDRLVSIAGRIDASAPTGDYFLQIVVGKVLPADGTVTHFMAPVKRSHVNGTDDAFNISFNADGTPVSLGAYLVLSTTEFTKTAAGNYLSATSEYK